MTSLNHRDATVIGMRPPSDGPQVIVGAALTSPVGPAVCVGASMAIDPGRGLALVAHLSPDDARDLANQLMVAAVAVDIALGRAGNAWKLKEWL